MPENRKLQQSFLSPVISFHPVLLQLVQLLVLPRHIWVQSGPLGTNKPTQFTTNEMLTELLTTHTIKKLLLMNIWMNKLIMKAINKSIESSAVHDFAKTARIKTAMLTGNKAK